MRIDLIKLILNLLPISLRKKLVEEYVRSLILEVPKTHNDFSLFSYDAKYKANANASVISLEHHIKREFDVQAKITELDGKSFDFLVSITGNVDENALRQLINSYKLFGKSYRFDFSSVEYTAEFVDYQCEDIDGVYSVEFIDFFCEDDRIVTITAIAFQKTDSSWALKISADRPVKSKIEVEVDVFISRNELNLYPPAFVQNFTEILYPGESDIEVGISASRIGSCSVTYITINPSSDDYYDYIIGE